MSRIEPTVLKAGDLSLAKQPSSPTLCSPTLPLASVGRRYVGQIIDGLISVFLYLICLKLAKYFIADTESATWMALAVAASYFLLSDGFAKGQSLAKKLLNISVVDKSSGAYCSYFQSFARNILSPFIGSIDAIFILFKGKRRLGDRMANTIVIKNQD